MTDKISRKLEELPKAPGVYFHKNAAGEIIYVGKAAVLRNRVRQYFQKSRTRDVKTDVLVGEIADIDWIEVESEIEALFLEAEMVRRYMPRYNILLRDDKSYLYVRIDMREQFPSILTTRRPLDDGARYFGPYLSGTAVRRALKYLRRVFPYSTHTVMPPRACLQYHLGLCPGPETGQLDAAEYKKSLTKLIMYLQGERSQLAKQLEREMNNYAKSRDYEAAAKVRNQMFALKNLKKQIIFSDKEFMDLSKDHALNDLVELLGLEKAPRRIEGYDISHMSGTNTVASMVVFTNGVAEKAAYRKFKMRLPGNDDFAHMNEVIKRRFAEKHLKSWGQPDLLLIDGGKGQLGAALEALQGHGSIVPAVGLAKKYEEIVIKKPLVRTYENTDGPVKPKITDEIGIATMPPVRDSNVRLNLVKLQQLGGFVRESDDFILINLPHNTNIVKLLQRIRDESHRFAVSYHSVLKVKGQTASLLDEIPGVGPATRKKLIKTFGSMRGVQQASESDLAAVLGAKKAQVVSRFTRPAE